jgi:hypothetical protein
MKCINKERKGNDLLKGHKYTVLKKYEKLSIDAVKYTPGMLNFLSVQLFLVFCLNGILKKHISLPAL